MTKDIADIAAPSDGNFGLNFFVFGDPKNWRLSSDDEGVQEGADFIADWTEPWLAKFWFPVE